MSTRFIKAGICFGDSEGQHCYCGLFSGQVESMSIELEEAKKKVAEFQKQCEEYLVVIVQQKRDADEQQKVK